MTVPLVHQSWGDLHCLARRPVQAMQVQEGEVQSDAP